MSSEKPPMSQKAKNYLANLVWEAAQEDESVRKVLDETFLDLQTDQEPNGEPFERYQVVRDKLQEINNREIND